MKTLILNFALAVAAASILPAIHAEPQVSNTGFSKAGAFHLTLSDGADVDVSSDLQTWTKYASVTQETMLEDLASRHMDRRFYRVHGGGAPTNIVGFYRATLPPGKMLLLGNSFGSILRLDSPEGRAAIFGVTNPPIKISLYTNGTFTAHTLNTASGNWEPRLRPIRVQEGFSIQNTGTSPLSMHLSGPVRQVRQNMVVPAGASLVVPLYPFAGSLAQVLSVSAKDGTQVLTFDENTQAYKTSLYDSLGGEGKWEPKLPDLRPGRAFIIKTAEALTWTNTVPAVR